VGTVTVEVTSTIVVRGGAAGKVTVGGGTVVPIQPAGMLALKNFTAVDEAEPCCWDRLTPRLSDRAADTAAPSTAV